MDNNSSIMQQIEKVNEKVANFLASKVFGGGDKRKVGDSFLIPDKSHFVASLTPCTMRDVISDEEFKTKSIRQRDAYEYDDLKGVWYRESPYVAITGADGSILSLGTLCQFATAQKFDESVQIPSLDAFKDIEGFEGKVIIVRGAGAHVVEEISKLAGKRVYCVVADGVYHSTTASGETRDFNYTVWAY